MSAKRRAFTATRPVKTERTHEENQERAYIAASRRSDRGLKARIESARRASEIHKKRTCRALRVTEQDVINEVMYEEEDDELPARYQRLYAHLHTTSGMFNKKLHDYIATQRSVRNMFMLQYQNPSYWKYGVQYPAEGDSFSQANNWLNTSTLRPSQFSPSTLQDFQQAQPYSSTATQQEGLRQSPYRTQQHSLLVQLPHAPPTLDSSAQQANGDITTPQGGVSQRMSLPPQAFEQLSRAAPDGQSRILYSRSPIVHSPQRTSSTSHFIMETPGVQPNADTSTSYTCSPTTYPMSFPVLNTNPL